ncbi:MAG TPA: sigma factor, partial [Candidatus Deferrimicrobium sp.]|nr:sigma factor [Candidatus Deferrimicrobium sp.]
MTAGRANRSAASGIWTSTPTNGGVASSGSRVTVASPAATRQDTASDEVLVRRAGSGDVAAFDALLASRLDRCYRLAWSILANEADAADATQDAFVAAWRQLPRLHDPAAFDAWLNRIVANAARMARRHRVRLREIEMPGETTGPAGVGSPAAALPPDPSGPQAYDDVAER